MLETARVNLDEASAAIQRLGDQLQLEPDTLQQIEHRMSRTISLARKHGVEPTQIPRTREALRDRLERISRFETLRAEAEDQVAKAEACWREASRTLSKARNEAAERLLAGIHAALGELGMSDAKVEFRIEHDPEKPVSASGADDVEILFSANPGQSPAPLGRVASGGELSRFSLALIIAAGDDAGGRVRIFDEIDAGVGGETAHAVGRFVHRASAGGQAFCVTHLAQVAACADQQFRVVKQPGRGSTRVAVQRLDSDQRVVELARMLGAADAETSRDHARAMLAAASGGGDRG
jgi:DNA repair protein RecN (Recombination protein N)